jgi:hypothetical protein
MLDNTLASWNYTADLRQSILCRDVIRQSAIQYILSHQVMVMAEYSLSLQFNRVQGVVGRFDLGFPNRNLKEIYKG